MRILLTLVALFSLTGLLGADETPAGKAPVAAPATAPEPAESKMTTPQPAAPSSEKFAAYQALLAPWKKILIELGQLRIEYETASPERQAEIRARYDALREEGRQLKPKLEAAALAAYAENPKADPELEDFLWHTCREELRNDDYEVLLKHARLLLDGGCQRKGLTILAGVAALCTNELDAAQKYFAAARKAGLDLSVGKPDYADHVLAQFVAEPDFFKKRWEKEQAIRKAEAKADDLPRVLLKTNKGDIEIELLENESPNTVANFISLIEKGYYDGLTFHRVLDGFMAQGGCPNGDGMGGPGYTIPCECGKPNHREHFRGSLSMAKTAQPDTGGSQFFLTFVPTLSLDGQHTVFGRVTKGIDVLAKIQRRDPSERTDTLPRPDRIIEAKVLRKRSHEYVPTKASITNE